MRFVKCGNCGGRLALMSDPSVCLNVDNVDDDMQILGFRSYKRYR